MNIGRLGVWSMLDPLAPAEMASAVQRIERLGYSALWIPNLPNSDPLVQSSWLLANTQELKIVTGIANIYQREPAAMAGAQLALAEQSGGRFLLGLGTSSKRVVEGVLGVKFTSPLQTMRAYLDKMDETIAGMKKGAEAPRILAAVGPKMMALARERSMGAHPYFMTPDHTRRARDILGPDAWLCVEQKVVLETDPGKARTAARAIAKTYLASPHYQQGWKSCGLDDADFQNGASDRFVDFTFAWGSLDKIKDRVKAHFDAGASHVCIQPVHPEGPATGIHWEALEAMKPTG